ncbi:hypothetical protein MTO96_000030 [Rhipicephalus appendiculatus]
MADRGKDDQVSCLHLSGAARFTRPLLLHGGGRPPPHNMAGAPGLLLLVLLFSAAAACESSLAPRWAKHCGAARRRRKWRSVPLLRIDFAGTPHRRSCCCGGKPTPPGLGTESGEGPPWSPDLCFARDGWPARVLRFACPAHLASATSAKPREVRTGLDRGRAKVTAARRPAFLHRMFTRLEVGCGSARLRAGKALLRSREPVAKVTRAGFCTLRCDR